MAKKLHFGTAAHFFEGGNNSSVNTTEQEVAEKAAKKARRTKIAKGVAIGAAGVGVVYLGVKGIKKLVKGKQEKEVSAPEEPVAPAEEAPAEEAPAEKKQQPKK